MPFESQAQKRVSAELRVRREIPAERLESRSRETGDSMLMVPPAETKAPSPSTPKTSQKNL